MPRYIIGVDEGTTSCRAGLYDIDKHAFVKIEQKPVDIFCPHEGYVEQDGEQIYNVFLEVVKSVMESEEARTGEILALTLTNQRESVVCFNKSTGRCVAPVINWQCRRTAKICDKIPSRLKRYIKNKTGLVVDAYFSASKIKWLLDHVPETQKLRQENKLAFGTIDSYLVFKLTNKTKFVTDYTNVSRTMLYDIKKLQYDKRLLKYFNIFEHELPEIVSNDEIIEEIELFGVKMMLCGIIGDQQSSLFGQVCFEKGEIKNTFGTGCFLVANTGEKKIKTKNLLSTIAFKLKNCKTIYAIEGSSFNAGSCIEWLKDINLINSSSESSDIAKSCSVSDSQLFFVPALTGLGAPYWDMNARGMLIGITRATKKNDIVKAVLDSIAFSTFDMLKLFQKHIVNINGIKCDGGVSKNQYLMQFISDLTGLNIIIPENHETTLLGAIFVCCIGLKLYNINQLKEIWKHKNTFLPNKIDSCKKIKMWQSAVKKSLKWIK